MTVLTAVLAVFTEVGDWIITAIQDMMPIFYSSTDGLTFIGVVSIAGLAFSTAFLIIRVISNFLNFRN